jgi:hypothetical protein
VFENRPPTNTSHILIKNISCQDINPKSTCNIQVFFVFQGCVEVDLNILTLDGNLPKEMTNNKHIIKALQRCRKGNPVRLNENTV